jgi:hypothetical protein
MVEQFRARFAAVAKGQGISVIWRPLQGNNPYPEVRWPAEDLASFLAAAQVMGAAAIYVGTHVLSEDGVGLTEERLVEAEHAYGPDAELSPEGQLLVDEAARHIAEAVALSAAFTADNVMHLWSVHSEWYGDFAARRDAHAERCERAWLQEHRSRVKRGKGQGEDLRTRLLEDDEFLRLPNDMARRTYARRLPVTLYGEDDGGTYEMWWPAMDQAWQERNSRIVPERTAQFRAQITAFNHLHLRLRLPMRRDGARRSYSFRRRTRCW